MKYSNIVYNREKKQESCVHSTTVIVIVTSVSNNKAALINTFVVGSFASNYFFVEVTFVMYIFSAVHGSFSHQFVPACIVELYV